MMATEAEAKTKNCPLTYSQPGGPFACVGSACMWWRLAWMYVDKDGQQVSQADVMAGIQAGAKASDFPMVWSDKGYCGILREQG